MNTHIKKHAFATYMSTWENGSKNQSNRGKNYIDNKMQEISRLPHNRSYMNTHADSIAPPQWRNRGKCIEWKNGAMWQVV